MPKVLCTLPNASTEINGVKFVEHAKGMVSEDVTDEVAAYFASIPGYSIVSSDSKPDAGVDVEKAALLARAEAVGLKTKSNWGLERLRAEVEEAEAAAKKDPDEEADKNPAEQTGGDK